MTQSPVVIYAVQNGQLVRYTGDIQPPNPTPPGVPTAVVGAAPTATSGTLTWAPPVTDGGSPVTGYVVSRPGVTPVTLLATDRSHTFGGLTPSTAYTLSVAAINAVGTGTAVSRTVTTPPVVVTGARFPGDPNPKVNGGRLYWGMASDNATGWTSLSSFETQAGVSVGIHHYYDNNAGIPSIAVPDATHPTRLGVIPSKAQTDLAAGRLPMGSTHVPGSNWPAAGNGTFDATTGAWIPDPAGGIYDTQIQAFIDWCEGSTSGTPNLSGPLWWIVNHEPEAGGGSPDGDSTAYRSWMNRIRWNLNKWEHDNSKKRAKLTFLTCHTAYMWAGGAGGPAAWWPGNGVADVAGVDAYAWTTNTTDSVVNGANFKKFHTFIVASGMPWAITEYGTLPTNTNGNNIIKEVYTYCTDGTQDCVALAYFNTGSWHLTNDNLTLSEAESEATNAKSIHVSDLGF